VATADPPPPSKERHFGAWLVAGAAFGVSLGSALGGHPRSPAEPLTPMGPSDAVVAGVAVGLLASPWLFDRGGGPADAATTSPAEANGFDRRIRDLAVGQRGRSGRQLLDNLSWSTLTATQFVPVGMLAGSNIRHKWSRDLPVVAEATALSMGLNLAVKHLVHRSRPEAVFCDRGSGREPCPADTRRSFYSGHTTSAFAAAVAAGTIADFHHLPDRKWIWGMGLGLATTTGVLRVMSDKHYATDVIAGVATGGLLGWLVPRLHKPDAVAVTTPTPTNSPPTAVLHVPLRAAGRSASVEGGVAGGGPYLAVAWRW
jgi:membrane-associated phospholipid phosphatase